MQKMSPAPQAGCRQELQRIKDDTSATQRKENRSWPSDCFPALDDSRLRHFQKIRHFAQRGSQNSPHLNPSDLGVSTDLPRRSFLLSTHTKKHRFLQPSTYLAVGPKQDLDQSLAKLIRKRFYEALSSQV